MFISSPRRFRSPGGFRPGSSRHPGRAPQQLRQLGDVGGDAARLVAGQQLGRRAPSRLIRAATSEAASAGLVLRYTFHCERAEGRILVADLLLRIESDVPPRPDFVHVLELENDDAIRWRLARYRKCLIDPASEVFAPIIIDCLLRGWEKVIFVTGLVLDRDFSN